MMEKLIQGFPAQLKEGLDNGREITLKPFTHDVKSVLITGMGGSGIGGDYTSRFASEDGAVPVIVNKGYDIPSWVNRNTLAIVSSYSGNTEETVNGLNRLLQTEARIICIASGGKIKETARLNDLDFVQLTAGIPSPRACLGYSITAQLAVLNKAGLMGKHIAEQLRISADLIKFEQEEIRSKAERIAQTIVGKTVILYGADKTEPVLLRWRQQFNENSKMLCWHHTIPEMNHNEIVGWHERNENFAVIFLRNKDDYKRNAVRMDFVKQTVSQFTPTIIEVYAKGQSNPERLIYLTHLGDWVSLYVARLKGVDASEINVIDRLKELLSGQE
jgi:glucose/mannose-6-phosphate isomerase